MNTKRTIFPLALAACASGAFASTGSETLPDLAVRYQPPAQVPVVAAAAIFAKPRVGVRVGGGSWKEFMVEGGVDVTFAVPFLPIPALRIDGEVWGKPSDFGGARRGNAFSILGIQTVMLGYFGLGPSYYFTDNLGQHKSGWGVKLLGGVNLPKGLYAEAGLIAGPNPAPVFFTLGMRF